MNDFLVTALISIVPFLVLITIIVTVHELGHFLTARAFGVAIDRFSIGFGKAIWRRTDKSGVEWRIGWIPIGGYVRFAGDSNDASVPDPEELEGLRKQIEDQLGEEQVSRFYHFKPVWQRALIAAAGPAANFALAVVIFASFLMINGQPVSPPQFGSIAPNSPAQAAGLLPGDIVQRLNGTKISGYDQIYTYVRMRAEEPIRFDILRGGQPLTLTVTPQRVTGKNGVTGYAETFGRIGAGPSNSIGYRRFNPLDATVEGTKMVGEIITGTVTYLRRIVTGRESASNLSGVVGMADVTGKIIKAVNAQPLEPRDKALTLWINILMFAGTISVGLGFVNLLPIPVLDGGHLLFYAYEAVARKPAGPRLQAASFKAGLALVVALMLFANWNDLQRMQAFKFLGGLFS